MGKEGVLREDHVWDVVFSFSLPVKELEFNKIGSTDRENGEVLFMFLLALPRCFTVRLISHARAHCRLPREPVCGGMAGMPGWSCHFNATATHIAPVRTQHAPNTGTTTYAQKSWDGHPRCDLAPLTTSFGTVGQWERQHLAMAATTSPEVVGWAPPV